MPPAATHPLLDKIRAGLGAAGLAAIGVEAFGHGLLGSGFMGVGRVVMILTAAGLAGIGAFLVTSDGAPRRA